MCVGGPGGAGGAGAAQGKMSQMSAMGNMSGLANATASATAASPTGPASISGAVGSGMGMGQGAAGQGISVPALVSSAVQTPNQQAAIAKNIAAAAENIPSGTTVSASNAATAKRRTQTRLTGTRRSLLGDPNLGQQALLG